MANLSVMSETPERIVLGKGGLNSPGSWVGMIVFAIVACVGLAMFLEEGGGINPIVIVIGLIIGIGLLGTITNAVRSTRVVIDANQKVATRADDFLFMPVSRQEMAFNVLKDVQLNTARKLSRSMSSSLMAWQVELGGTDGSRILVDDRGGRAEMQALAEKIGLITRRPVRDMTAATAATATIAPPVAASPNTGRRSSPDAPYLETSARQRKRQAVAAAPIVGTSVRMAGDQLAAGAPMAVTSAYLANEQMSAFSSDADVQAQMNAAQNAAGQPYNQASARLAMQQAQARSAMGFSMPPVLTMPEMPAMASFGPAVDLPSLPPLGSMMAFMELLTPLQDAGASAAASAVLLSDSLENETPDNAATEFRTARQLHAARNYQEARAAYERALDYDPGSTKIHNDLGVLLFEQNKLTDAERAFRQAIALEAFYGPSRYNLGLTLRRRGNNNQALEQFRLGVQQASREWEREFQEALRGNLHAPILSA